MYLMFVFMPLGMLGMIINLMSQAGASAKRIFRNPGRHERGRGG